MTVLQNQSDSSVLDDAQPSRWRGGPSDTDPYLKGSSEETVIINGKNSSVVINGPSSDLLDGKKFVNQVETRLRRMMEQTKTGHSRGVRTIDPLVKERIRSLQGQVISDKDGRKMLVEEVLGGGSNPSKETIKAQLQAAVNRMHRGETVRFVIRKDAEEVAKIAYKYLKQIRQHQLSDKLMLRVDGAGKEGDKVSKILKNVRSRKTGKYHKAQLAATQGKRATRPLRAPEPRRVSTRRTTPSANVPKPKKLKTVQVTNTTPPKAHDPIASQLIGFEAKLDAEKTVTVMVKDAAELKRAYEIIDNHFQNRSQLGEVQRKVSQFLEFVGIANNSNEELENSAQETRTRKLTKEQLAAERTIEKIEMFDVVKERSDSLLQPQYHASFDAKADHLHKEYREAAKETPASKIRKFGRWLRQQTLSRAAGFGKNRRFV